MDYENIKKYIGEEWLNKQKEFISAKKWIEKIELKDKIPNSPAFYFLEKIDELIKKFENIEGFSQWALESKTTDNFEDALFELMVLDNLLLRSDSLQLKVVNQVSGKIPEALMRKGEQVFYVEMKKLRDLPNSISNKVDSLFRKARDKFKGSQGILFIGTFNFFEYPGGNKKILSEFNLLKKLIQLRFERGFGSSTIAFILVNFVIKTNFEKTAIEKEYHIINKPLEKGGMPTKFFEDIFEVDSFRYL
ncbi:MAG: hypothetical protein Q8N63_08190 [Nanoarchaeota archaeon]|nr:hypothetical protein [Nanoarchaeota archaeon]